MKSEEPGVPAPLHSAFFILNSAFKMALPAGLSPASPTFEASHSGNRATGARRNVVMDCWSGGLMGKTAPNLGISNPLIQKLHHSSPRMVGRHGAAPCSAV